MRRAAPCRNVPVTFTLGLMNTLSFRTSTENGLSFELLVDGQSLGSLIGARDSEITYWIVDDDLPYYPPFGNDRDMSKRIVAVCSCGEYGCGHAQCRLVLGEETVELLDFDFDVTGEGSKKRFSFARSNYEQVIQEVVRLAREHAADEP